MTYKPPINIYIRYKYNIYDVMSYLAVVSHFTAPMTARRALHPLNYLNVHIHTHRHQTNTYTKDRYSSCGPYNPLYTTFSPILPIINKTFMTPTLLLHEELDTNSLPLIIGITFLFVLRRAGVAASPSGA